MRNYHRLAEKQGCQGGYSSVKMCLGTTGASGEGGKSDQAHGQNCRLPGYQPPEGLRLESEHKAASWLNEGVYGGTSIPPAERKPH